MNGFSERDTEVSVGHLLGLRWFQLTLRCPYHGDSGHVYCRPQCNGGERVPVLKGAWGAWEPGENEAACKRYGERRGGGGGAYLDYDGYPERHEVPARECGCGFWAYWVLGDKRVPPPSVVAIVKGYGRTIEGDLGFRCSHARIIALHLPNWDEAAALALEQRYEVPVYFTLPVMLLRHLAPEGQPPLQDDFFSRGRDEEGRGTWRPAFTGTGGGRQPGESYHAYAVRMGLTAGSVPCLGCGTLACAPGQAFCANCQVNPVKRCEQCGARGAHVCSPVTSTAVTGADAVTQLHARREGWAKDALADWASRVRGLWQNTPGKTTLPAIADEAAKIFRKDGK
jgi:hypothetical protein